MTESLSPRRWPAAALLLLGVIAVLHVLGLYAYVSRNVLVYPWLWDNPDYMLFLGPIYFHGHHVLLILHLYLLGPFLLLRKFRQRWWPLYWTSAVVALGLSVVPLARIQRLEALYGRGAYLAVAAFFVLLLLGFLSSIARPRPRSQIVAFHVLSGYPITLRFFLCPEASHTANALWLWGLLALHGIAFAYLRGTPLGGLAQEPARARQGRAVTIALGAVVVIFAAATLPHHYLHLFYARHQLTVLLDAVGYAQTPSAPPLEDPTPPPNHRRFRTYDGSWNNLDHPEIGRAGTPLGRYEPASGDKPRDVTGAPSVMTISDNLFKQETFLSSAPVKINALAMAWVNFFVHDFYNRGVSDALVRPTGDEYRFELPDGKAWYMGKLRSPDGKTHFTSVTHWFDGSQIYGSSEATALALRTMTDGRMKVGEGGFLPWKEMTDPQGNVHRIFLTADAPRSSLHVGSMLFHHLWVDEHNYLAGELKQRYPQMSDEELYQTARLIVGAEIAKVHTVEWTAQMTFDRVSVDFLRRVWEQSGNPEKYRKDRYYAVSEEFVSSYMLHEIVPPTLDVVDDQGKVVETTRFVRDMFLFPGQERLLKYGVPAMFNSFGVNPMGLIVPFNVVDDFRRNEDVPRILKRLNPNRPADEADYIDLGAILFARDRDARVPTYNDLRVRLAQPRLKSFSEVTRDPKVVAALEASYDDIEDVEYLIGYKAESRPSTWALTYTQVRTFLPVVVYRIICDRFYTLNFNAETYTEYGMERIREVKLHDIIKRAYGPSLLPADREAPIFNFWAEKKQ